MSISLDSCVCCSGLSHEPCMVCGCRNFRGQHLSNKVHFNCQISVKHRLDRLAGCLSDAGLAAAGAQRGADRMIAVVTKELDDQERCRIDSREAILVELGKVTLLMMAAKRRL